MTTDYRPATTRMRGAVFICFIFVFLFPCLLSLQRTKLLKFNSTEFLDDIRICVSFGNLSSEILQQNLTNLIAESWRVWKSLKYLAQHVLNFEIPSLYKFI